MEKEGEEGNMAEMAEREEAADMSPTEPADSPHGYTTTTVHTMTRKMRSGNGTDLTFTGAKVDTREEDVQGSGSPTNHLNA